MSKLSDRTQELIEQAKSLNLDSEEFDETLVVRPDDSDEVRNKAIRKWKQNRELTQTALALASDAIKEIDKKKTTKAPAKAPVTDREDQSAMYLSNLEQRAMQKTGISDPTNSLVKMETQRLYEQDAKKAEARVGADGKVDSVFDSVTSDFKLLDDEDKEAIKANLSGLDVLEKTDPEVVKKYIHLHMGANVDKYAKGTKKPKAKPGVVSPAAASVSSVRSQGVPPGETSVSGSGDEEVIEPATAEELHEMKKVEALDVNNPRHVKMYRSALLKKDKYAAN